MPQSPPRVVISLTGKAVCAARRVNCISGFAFCACDVLARFAAPTSCFCLMTQPLLFVAGFRPASQVYFVFVCVFIFLRMTNTFKIIYRARMRCVCVRRVGWCWRARARAVHAHLNQGRQGHARAEPEGACPVRVIWHVMLCVRCCTMQPLRYSRV